MTNPAKPSPQMEERIIRARDLAQGSDTSIIFINKGDENCIIFNGSIIDGAHLLVIAMRQHTAIVELVKHALTHYVIDDLLSDDEGG